MSQGKCVYCGAETSLYEIGLPICLICIDRSVPERLKIAEQTQPKSKTAQSGK